MELTARDDGFHTPPVDDPMWTETTWWGFLAPQRPLGGMIYTLFRPNLGVAAVVIQVWDETAVEPWRLPYARSRWHVPHPTDDLTHCTVGGLTISCLEPLNAYRLTYEDGDAVAIDLTYTGMEAPHAVEAGERGGHFDQLCRVSGNVRLGSDVVAIHAPALRDRSWYVRDDERSLRAGYTYGVVDDERFLTQSFHTGESAADETLILGGFLTRDGQTSRLVGGTRRVVERRRGHPDVLEIEATDEAGRTLSATGRTLASAASQSTPGMFAWMSVVEWLIDGRSGHGEDHDVWSPDLLAAERARLLP
jgi:hypothetical protein